MTHKMNVLVVDDNEDTREMYASFLKHNGANVASARDGKTALEVARFQCPDVIVLDLGLVGGLNGWDVLSDLRKNPKTRAIRVVLLTGHNERERALRDGADAFCQKPCLPDALLSELRRVTHK